jgi:hypothetical protein
MMFPAAFLGDFSTERSVLLGVIPDYADDGENIRAVHVLVGEDVSLNGQDYWVLQLGAIREGTFKARVEIQQKAKLTANVPRRFEIADPVLLAKGDKFTARLSPRGLPPQLVGLSIVIEWGVHASRRS